MLVEGHTDSQGSDKVNQPLSLNRGNAVRDYLVTRGVVSEKITAAGLGSTRPLVDNKSAENRANNRRVEIVISAAPISARYARDVSARHDAATNPAGLRSILSVGRVRNHEHASERKIGELVGGNLGGRRRRRRSQRRRRPVPDAGQGSVRVCAKLPNPNDKDRVDRLLRRAQVDAELSLALAQGEDQKAAAQAAIDKVTKFNRDAPSEPASCRHRGCCRRCRRHGRRVRHRAAGRAGHGAHGICACQRRTRGPAGVCGSAQGQAGPRPGGACAVGREESPQGGRLRLYRRA